MIIKFRLTLFLIPLILLQCTDREHTNPFDPDSNTNLPVSLRLIPEENRIQIEWSLLGITDYTGFRLYRSVNNDSNFVLLREFQKQTDQFTDTEVAAGNWYYYRM
ncbi:MAG: hypothetical protein WAN36_11005, partial [Calditrichia bacterium]